MPNHWKYLLQLQSIAVIHNSFHLSKHLTFSSHSFNNTIYFARHAIWTIRKTFHYACNLLASIRDFTVAQNQRQTLLPGTGVSFFSWMRRNCRPCTEATDLNVFLYLLCLPVTNIQLILLTEICLRAPAWSAEAMNDQPIIPRVCKMRCFAWEHTSDIYNVFSAGLNYRSWLIL